MIHKAYIFLLIFFVSCGSKNPVPKEKMEQIIWDVALGNEYLNKYVVMSHPDINRGAAYNQLLEKILKKNNVGLKDFNESINYYLKKEPKIFERILDSIAVNQGIVFEKYKKDKAANDSLRALKDSASIKKDSLALKDSLSKSKVTKDSLAALKPSVVADSTASKNTLNKEKEKITKKKTKKSKKKKSKKKKNTVKKS